jgi:AcrR family transcriptional regulator
VQPRRATPTTGPEAREAALSAAERLYYERGVHAVGMDDIRDAASVSLRALYRAFPSKDDLVLAWLDRRHDRWMEWLRDEVDSRDGDPVDRVLSIFDALSGWIESPRFRGCAFVNVAAELGAAQPGVLERSAAHKRSLHAYVLELLGAAGWPDAEQVAGQLLVLVDGALVQAHVAGNRTAAAGAKELARLLLRPPG